MNTEDVNSKLKNINITGTLALGKGNGNTWNQLSQVINSDNFKNPEDIRIKPLTDLFSPIKALKYPSRGIFENNLKSTMKPFMKIMNLTSEARNLKTQPNKSALNSPKEISLKYKITRNNDLKPQDNHRVQEKKF
ncbi:hypothetical protein O181_117301 [Austropuccinia psidii MF-1]|uniref:Uncharacterized protein n=1 Tax=Austropuccinia psidii MF-1 TaxID=1389203 RepID=A0A9Q3KCE2_9BASI|nr:hypothetical protein [Austropuccinia psidii MF-1]